MSGKKAREVPQEERNYETRVDTFIPAILLQKDDTERRIYPQKAMDRYSLQKRYERAYGDKRF